MLKKNKVTIEFGPGCVEWTKSSDINWMIVRRTLNCFNDIQALHKENKQEYKNCGFSLCEIMRELGAPITTLDPYDVVWFPTDEFECHASSETPISQTVEAGSAITIELWGGSRISDLMKKEK